MVDRRNHDQQDPTAGAIPASLHTYDKRRLGEETSDLNSDRHIDGAETSFRDG
jgi:hypothetical protein